MWLLKYAKYKRYIKENINKNKKPIVQIEIKND